MVITEVTSNDFREIFPNPCLKKIYTLKDNINVEEKCLDLLNISKDSFDKQKKKCYYYPKNIKNDDEDNDFTKINSSRRLINQFYITLLIMILF